MIGREKKNQFHTRLWKTYVKAFSSLEWQTEIPTVITTIQTRAQRNLFGQLLLLTCLLSAVFSHLFFGLLLAYSKNRKSHSLVLMPEKVILPCSCQEKSHSPVLMPEKAILPCSCQKKPFSRAHARKSQVDARA